MNRQDLFDYKNNKEWVKDRLEDVFARKELLNKLSSTYGDNPRGSSSIQDRIAEDLTELMDETIEYEKTLVKLKEKVIKIENIIDQIENSTYRNILYKMYISENPKNLTEISNDINKEYKYTIKLHSYALNEFDKISKKVVLMTPKVVE